MPRKPAPFCPHCDALSDAIAHMVGLVSLARDPGDAPGSWGEALDKLQRVGREAIKRHDARTCKVARKGVRS